MAKNLEFARSSVPARLPQLGVRMLGSALLLVVMTGWLRDHIMALDGPAIFAAVSAAQPSAWAFAAVATAVSFAAVGAFEGLVHRHMATGLPDAVVRRSGMAAIAISQVLGFGLFTGTIMRCRMLPGQDLRQAATVTGHVTALFLMAWAAITAATLASVPGAPMQQMARLVLAGMLVTALGTSLHPRLHRGWLAVPNLITWAGLLLVAAVDLSAASLALWSFAPDGLAYADVLVAFLLALGAGLVANTPGGIGVFEITLVALLPATPPEPLLAAVLAWRVVYHALPSALAALAALAMPGKPLPQTPPADRLEHLARTAGCAETGLRHQKELVLLPLGRRAACLAGRTPHHLIAVFDPFAPRHAAGAPALVALARLARAEARSAAIYKVSGRCAAKARAAGWHPLRIAREAVLAPQDFTLNRPDRAGLRRKLRRATQAGISVQPMCHPLPEESLARVAGAWARAHGGERGFSMGRFCPDLLRHQKVFVALHRHEIVAFASFHQAPHEWTLDLLRHTASAPDGTMQHLILAALAAANAQGVARLSLAAIPEAAFAVPGSLWMRVARGFDDSTGLLRFKSGFAPRWEARYLCAPHRIGIVSAGVAIARAVRFPAPLARAHREYGIASRSEAWQWQSEDLSL